MEALTPYIILVLTGCGVVIWYLYRRTQVDIHSLNKRLDQTRTEFSKEMADYRLHVAESYVTNNELSKAIEAVHRSIDAVFELLHRIDDKIDRKADK